MKFIPKKFRYWNTYTDEMLYSDDYYIFNIYRLKDMQNTLMQFTGLLDCNGKEIYEGDILKLSHLKKGWFGENNIQQNEYQYSYGIVEYGLYKLNFVHKAQYGDLNSYDHVTGFYIRAQNKIYALDFPIEWREVMGNIFKNPELIPPDLKFELINII